MRYRLIYSKHYLTLSLWSNDYSWILERSIRLYACGYDVEIWEYNEQGSRLLERSIHHG